MKKFGILLALIAVLAMGTSAFAAATPLYNIGATYFGTVSSDSLYYPGGVAGASVVLDKDKADVSFDATSKKMKLVARNTGNSLTITKPLMQFYGSATGSVASITVASKDASTANAYSAGHLILNDAAATPAVEISFDVTVMDGATFEVKNGKVEGNVIVKKGGTFIFDGAKSSSTSISADVGAIIKLISGDVGLAFPQKILSAVTLQDAKISSAGIEGVLTITGKPQFAKNASPTGDVIVDGEAAKVEFKLGGLQLGNGKNLTVKNGAVVSLDERAWANNNSVSLDVAANSTVIVAKANVLGAGVLALAKDAKLAFCWDNTAGGVTSLDLTDAKAKFVKPVDGQVVVSIAKGNTLTVTKANGVLLKRAASTSGSSWTGSFKLDAESEKLWTLKADETTVWIEPKAGLQGFVTPTPTIDTNVKVGEFATFTVAWVSNGVEKTAAAVSDDAQFKITPTVTIEPAGAAVVTPKNNHTSILVDGKSAGTVTIKLDAVDGRSVSKDEGTVSFTVKIGTAAPVGKVLDGTATPASLTFTDKTPQEVTVAWTYNGEAITDATLLTVDAPVVDAAVATVAPSTTGSKNKFTVTPVANGGPVNLKIHASYGDVNVSKDMLVPVTVAYLETAVVSKDLDAGQKKIYDDAKAAAEKNVPSTLDHKVLGGINAAVTNGSTGIIVIDADLSDYYGKPGFALRKIKANGDFATAFSPAGSVAGTDGTFSYVEATKKLTLYIKDNSANFDLDTRLGTILDPVMAVKTKSGSSSGGGCNVAYAPFALLLAAPLFFLRKKD